MLLCVSEIPQAEYRGVQIRTLPLCELPFERSGFPLWLMFRLYSCRMKKLFFWPCLPSTHIYQCLNTYFKKHAVTKSGLNCFIPLVVVKIIKLALFDRG